MGSQCGIPWSSELRAVGVANVRHRCCAQTSESHAVCSTAMRPGAKLLCCLVTHNAVALWPSQA
eukprot:6770767-Lingulodinium_polyedra.AAC.1